MSCMAASGHVLLPVVIILLPGTQSRSAATSTACVRQQVQQLLASSPRGKWLHCTALHWLTFVLTACVQHFLRHARFLHNSAQLRVSCSHWHRSSGSQSMGTNCRRLCALTVTLHVGHLVAAAHRKALKLQPIACIMQRCCMLYKTNSIRSRAKTTPRSPQ
jgi:hypothetical protein